MQAIDGMKRNLDPWYWPKLFVVTLLLNLTIDTIWNLSTGHSAPLVPSLLLIVVGGIIYLQLYYDS